jgi:hypothetical protein
MNFRGHQRKDPGSPGSPTLSDASAVSSNLSALTLASDATVVSQYTPDEYERTSYYNGITGDGSFTVRISSLHPSGSLVWHTRNGKARIVGQLHSGNNKGGSTSNHVTYCAPGWYFLGQIRKKFKHADFYRTTWSA